MPLSRIYEPIYNYIYLYHTDKLLIIPTYPENMNDSTNITYGTTTPLGRTAPIYSYTNSGPRTINFQFKLHRDMMWQANYGVSNVILEDDDDYVDEFIKQIQAAALPVYAASQKMVDPPLVAVRISNDVYIKGVISGSVGIDYQLPIDRNDKYAVVGINFGVNEVDPYDAEIVQRVGSYRDTGEIIMDTSLDKNSYISGAGTAGSGVFSQRTSTLPWS